MFLNRRLPLEQLAGNEYSKAVGSPRPGLPGAETTHF